MNDTPWAAVILTGVLSLTGGCAPEPEEPSVPGIPPLASASALAEDGTLGEWSVQASPEVPREHPRAVLLSSGSVLVVGEASAELSPPGGGGWTATEAPQLAHRTHFTLTRLGSGQVLLVGGLVGVEGEWPWPASAEVYEPRTGTWRDTRGPPSLGRSHHTATLLDSGKVLVVGGMHTPLATESRAELYDPDTGEWSPAGELLGALGQTATLLESGEVLVTGGQVPSSRRLDEVFRYDPRTNAWTHEADMPRARANHAAVRLASGEVMVLGGGWGEVDLYTPRTRQWTEGPPLPFGNAVSATRLPSGEVLALSAAGQAALYSPTTRAWRLTPPLRHAHAEDAATLVLPSGEVLVIGGTGAPSAVERYTPPGPGTVPGAQP